MTEAGTALQVIIADDHPLMRSGIRMALSSDAAVEVIAEASNGDDMQQLCKTHQPDILVMDIGMPGPGFMDRVDYIKALEKEIKILVLTAYDDAVYVRAMFQAGVEGYVLKDEVGESLLTALHAVARGGSYFSRRVIDKLHTPTFEADAVASLTARERTVLDLISKGLNNTRISDELDLAPQTVRNYVSRLYEKTGISSRVGLAVWALQHNLGDSEA